MNYLIHSGPGIGDIIQFLSMARAIKEQDHNSRVDLIIRGSERTQELDQQIIDCQDYVDTLYWYSSKAICHDISLLMNLRMNNYDYGFVRIGSVTGEKSIWIYKIMRICGCKKIIGFGTDKVDVKIDVPDGTHYLERNAMLLAPASIKGRTNAIAINHDKLDEEWLHTLAIPEDKRVIGISLGTNPMTWYEEGNTIVYDVKSWPYKYWIELINMLIQNDYYVIVLGGKKEKDELIHQELQIPIEERVIDLVGKTTIKQSLTAISRCSIMVGAEGGMMHCASSIGVKTLTLFGGSDYRVWNPGGNSGEMINLNLNCAPCFCTSIGAHCKEHKCLTKITPQMVKDRIIKIAGCW